MLLVECLVSTSVDVLLPFTVVNLVNVCLFESEDTMSKSSITADAVTNSLMLSWRLRFQTLSPTTRQQHFFGVAKLPL